MATRFMVAMLVVLGLGCLLGMVWGPGLRGKGSTEGSRPEVRKGLPARSVGVLLFSHPETLHDGVKWHLRRWVQEMPRQLLEESTLRVARPASVERLRTSGDELLSGQQLGVATVLTGRVESSEEGDRLVVEAELVETETGLLLWAKTFEIEDIFKKNEELERIRREIVAGVKQRLMRESPGRERERAEDR